MEKKYEKSKDAFLKSLQYDPNHIISNYNLGVIYYLTKSYDSAILQWERVIQLAPDSQAAKKAQQMIHQIAHGQPGHEHENH